MGLACGVTGAVFNRAGNGRVLSAVLHPCYVPNGTKQALGYQWGGARSLCRGTIQCLFPRTLGETLGKTLSIEGVEQAYIW